jgi:6-phospho-3-hexuloisomerase
MNKLATDTELYDQSVESVLDECRIALNRINPSVIDDFMKIILAADKVYFIGVGRVMLSLMAMAKRLAHLGIQTYIVGQITEPAITNRDLLIVGSGSGESLIPVAIARKAKSLGVRIVHIGSNPESSLKPITDLFIRIPVQTKLARSDEIKSQQPMTSLFEQSLLLLGDVIAKMIVERQHMKMDNLWQFHANLE